MKRLLKTIALIILGTVGTILAGLAIIGYCLLVLGG